MTSPDVPSLSWIKNNEISLRKTPPTLSISRALRTPRAKIQSREYIASSTTKRRIFRSANWDGKTRHSRVLPSFTALRSRALSATFSEALSFTRRWLLSYFKACAMGWHGGEEKAAPMRRVMRSEIRFGFKMSTAHTLTMKCAWVLWIGLEYLVSNERKSVTVITRWNVYEASWWIILNVGMKYGKQFLTYNFWT